MTEPAYKGKEPLPLSVYVSARAGDPQAVERLLRYYDNYMNCLCTRTLYDEDGYPHLCVDEYMKRCLEIRLIQAIVAQLTVKTALYVRPILSGALSLKKSCCETCGKPFSM